jgi:hypothetical protein
MQDYGYRKHARSPGLEVVPRDEHLRRFGKDYSPGQHVTKLGPTGRGKTTLSGEMLGKVISPDFQVVVLHGKIQGRDSAIPRMAERYNLRIVHTWPPPPSLKYRKKKINGYILMPLQHAGESTIEENALLQAEFRRAIHSNYAETKVPTITHVDESHQAQETLKLKTDLEGPLMRGAPHNAEWNNVQRGRFVSYHCYDAPEHIIIFYDPDESNQKRYAEIGGVDKNAIIDHTSNLRTERAASGQTISQALYIRRSGPEMYIIDT